MSAALALRFARDDGLTRELLAAEIDGSPASAIQDADAREWRVSYPTRETRDAARVALGPFCRAHDITIQPVDVDDEDWARRSQAQLKAVRVGDIIVAPPWDLPRDPTAFRPARGAPPPLARARRRGSAALPSGGPPQRASVRVGDPGASRGPQALPIVIVIEPSMGFGTGHHASTRLCLLAMQKLDLRGRRVIDVGTGSGVLAIAAAALGAARVLAIDTDADAVQNARENVARNRPAAAHDACAAVIEVRVADVASLTTEPADLTVANLTAAWLRRLSQALVALTRPHGTLVVSGLQEWETDDVLGAFAGRAAVGDVLSAEGWASLTLLTI